MGWCPGCCRHRRWRACGAQPHRPGHHGDVPGIGRSYRGCLANRSVTLDGEIVAFDSEGRTNFGLLQQRLGLSGNAVQRVQRLVPVTYLIFDVLTLDGEPLLDKPYDQRREVLDDLGIAGEHCRVPGQLHGAPADVLARTKADGWEGMIAKKSDSRYLPGRRSSRVDQGQERKGHRGRRHRLGAGPGATRRDDRVAAVGGAGRIRMAVRGQGRDRIHRQDARRPGRDCSARCTSTSHR